jgi:hypothetical protein
MADFPFLATAEAFFVEDSASGRAVDENVTGKGKGKRCNSVLATIANRNISF